MWLISVITNNKLVIMVSTFFLNYAFWNNGIYKEYRDI